MKSIIYPSDAERIRGERFKDFLKKSFETLSPGRDFMENWHIDVMSRALMSIYAGDIKRLIINIPPRNMKSMCISTAFPAWVLAQNPTQRIIAASYTLHLSEKFSLDTKTVMESQWYQNEYPETIFSKNLNTKMKFATTMGGFRLATSVSGSLTGEGGDILIVDDPQKPNNIRSDAYRDKTFDWLSNTLFSRLDSKKNGKIIMVMQRLHIDDIVGRITGNKVEDKLIQEINGWTIINMPAIAKEDEAYRKKGECLNNSHEDLETLEITRQTMGEYHFNAQYQQSPQSGGNGHLKASQIHIWEGDGHDADGQNIDEFENSAAPPVYASVDTAFKCGENNDYTAVSIWREVENGEKISVIFDEVISKKLEFGELITFLENLFNRYNINKMLIEDKGSGISIIQTLRRTFGEKIVAVRPNESKEGRFLSSITYINSADAMFSKNIPQEAINQLLEFPHAKHDDIVDSVSQFITWYFTKMKRYTPPTLRFL